jgi:hypothetical protein
MLNVQSTCTKLYLIFNKYRNWLRKKRTPKRFTIQKIYTIRLKKIQAKLINKLISLFTFINNYNVILRKLHKYFVRPTRLFPPTQYTTNKYKLTLGLVKKT